MGKVKGKPIDTTTKAIANWDQELADAAKKAAKVASQLESGGAKRINIQAGVMMIDENPVPGNTLVGIIAGFTLHNKFFTQEYDSDNPTSPDCYAYGEDAEEMGPHDEAENKQAERCDGCSQNEWGSAEKGRGKACRNTVQLMVLPVGDYDHKADQFDAPEESADVEDAEAHALSIPPTSLKAFRGFIDKLSARLRPTWAVYTRISVTPDPKTQWKVGFTPVEDVNSTLLAACKARNEQAMKELVVAYPKNSEREAAKPAKGPGNKRKRF